MKWNKKDLRKWKTQKTLVIERNRYWDGKGLGFVEAWGREWLLMRSVDNGCLADGYRVIRRTSIRSLKPAPHADFSLRALELLKQEWPPVPKLRGMDERLPGELILSALKAFPLVVFHPGKADPAVCHIGREAKVSNKNVSWTEINPSARMEDFKTKRPLRDITRVDFGGVYETALWLVYSHEQTDR